MKKILIIFGTRPEAIKLAPLIIQLKYLPNIDLMTCHTGQHRELVEDALETFNIEPDLDLDLMQDNQQPLEFLSECITTLNLLFDEYTPNVVIVQGDTTSTLAGALTAYHRKVPVAHVEAGLRTQDLYEPFPEEGNRKLVDHISTLQFAPTQESFDNLKEEGLDPVLTGNTIVDAINIVRDKILEKEPVLTKYQILVTVHRRENFGEPLNRVMQAVMQLTDICPHMEFLWPVHPNPNVRKKVDKTLSGIGQIKLVEPMNYEDMIRSMMASRIIMTDSGGLQEEAPSLRRPVLILREKTERPEVVGKNALLVGTYPKNIINAVCRLLDNPAFYHKTASHPNPFGDGWASKRIINELIRLLYPADLRFAPSQNPPSPRPAGGSPASGQSPAASG